MHALVDDPALIPPARYRRFVQRTQVCGLLPDHVVYGEPYLALNALVLDGAESDALRRLTEVFASAFDKAGRRLKADVPALVEMGFPWVAAELLSAEEPQTPLVGRFDFVQDWEGRWWLLEFNADTPSGIRESLVADLLVQAMLPAGRGLRRPNDGLDRALTAAFIEATKGLAEGRALGLVTSAGELEDLAQMAFTRDLLRPPLAERGVEVVLGDVDDLRAAGSGLALRGSRLGALYRYVPFEGMLGTPAFAAVYAAVAAGRLRLLNGLYGLLLQHKSVLAWLWANRDNPDFTAAERTAIANHLPPTWPIAGCPVGVPRSALVAKQVFGREGEEVYFGEDLTERDWDLLRARRTYVAQQRVAVAEVAAAVPTSLGQERRNGRVTVGAFAVRGRWAGYFSRFGGKVITSRAKWVATYVEPHPL